jgi:hypothetical protein
VTIPVKASLPLSTGGEVGEVELEHATSDVPATIATEPKPETSERA